MKALKRSDTAYKQKVKSEFLIARKELDSMEFLKFSLDNYELAKTQSLDSLKYFKLNGSNHIDTLIYILMEVSMTYRMDEDDEPIVLDRQTVDDLYMKSHDPFVFQHEFQTYFDRRSRVIINRFDSLIRNRISFFNKFE